MLSHRCPPPPPTPLLLVAVEGEEREEWEERVLGGAQQLMESRSERSSRRLLQEMKQTSSPGITRPSGDTWSSGFARARLLMVVLNLQANAPIDSCDRNSSDSLSNKPA